MKENVETLREQYAELSRELSDPAVLKDQNKYQALTREHARIHKKLDLGERYLGLSRPAADF